MNELTEKLKQEFRDKETRQIYADDFLNTSIATQLKVLREQRGLTQTELAELAGMRQERISVLEDVNYSSWTINVLRRLADAFDLRLSVKFESFGSFLYEFETFDRQTLERPSFEDDIEFHGMPQTTAQVIRLNTNIQQIVGARDVFISSLDRDVPPTIKITSTDEAATVYWWSEDAVPVEAVSYIPRPQSTLIDYTSRALPF